MAKTNQGLGVQYVQTIPFFGACWWGWGLKVSRWQWYSFQCSIGGIHIRTISPDMAHNSNCWLYVRRPQIDAIVRGRSGFANIYIYIVIYIYMLIHFSSTPIQLEEKYNSRPSSQFELERKRDSGSTFGLNIVNSPPVSSNSGTYHQSQQNGKSSTFTGASMANCCYINRGHHGQNGDIGGFHGHGGTPSSLDGLSWKNLI